MYIPFIAMGLQENQVCGYEFTIISHRA